VNGLPSTGPGVPIASLRREDGLTLEFLSRFSTRARSSLLRSDACQSAQWVLFCQWGAGPLLPLSSAYWELFSTRGPPPSPQRNFAKSFSQNHHYLPAGFLSMIVDDLFSLLSPRSSTPTIVPPPLLPQSRPVSVPSPTAISSTREDRIFFLQPERSPFRTKLVVSLISGKPLPTISLDAILFAIRAFSLVLSAFQQGGPTCPYRGQGS